MEAKDKGSQHRLAYMLHVTGIEEATKPKHNLTDDELAKAKKRLDRIGRPVCLIFPYSNRGERAWGFNYWLDTATGIRERGIDVCFVAEELPQIDFPKLTGLSIREVAALVAIGDIVACNDSFPLHLAGTLGTPCVAVLGPSNPNVFHYENLLCVLNDFHCCSCHWRSPFRPACRFACEAMNYHDPAAIADYVKQQMGKAGVTKLAEGAVWGE